MRSPSGFLRGYVIFERFSRFFRVSLFDPLQDYQGDTRKIAKPYTESLSVFKALHAFGRSDGARRHRKIFRPSHSGENSGSFLSKMVVKSQQIPTGTLRLSRKSRAMRAHRSARVGTTREPLSQRPENSCLVFAKIGKNFW